MSRTTISDMLTNFCSMNGLDALSRTMLLLPQNLCGIDTDQIHDTCFAIKDLVSKTKLLSKLPDWIGTSNNEHHLQWPQKKIKDLDNVTRPNYVVTFYSVAGLCDAIDLLKTYCDINITAPLYEIGATVANNCGRFSVYANQVVDLAKLKNIKDFFVILGATTNLYEKLFNTSALNKKNDDSLSTQIHFAAIVTKTVAPIFLIVLSRLGADQNILYCANAVSTFSRVAAVALQ